jgi:hypothetical protein
MEQATFDGILDAIEHLPVDAQADLFDLLRRRLAERGRQRVIDDVREARSEYHSNLATPVTVDDLMREIQS